jgi:hypothetical protein
MLATLALVGSVPTMVSCSLVTTMWGKPDAFLVRAERPLSATGLVDFRGVVHCHSFRSHDSTGTIEAIAAACEEVGMDFLVMTDHLTPHSVSRGKRGMVGNVLFLVGAELRPPGGTLLAFPLKHYVRPHKTLQAYFDDIHGQGGLAIVGHAELYTRWDHPGIDGVEVQNLHAAAMAANPVGLGLKALFTPLHVLFWSLAVPDPEVFARWDAANERAMVPAFGGNDAHANIRVLGPFGWVLGNYTELFRVVSTHVLAKRLDEASLVAAMRAGRTYVSYDIWRDGSGFAFWAVDEATAHEMGATVPVGARLHVRAPSRGEIRMLRGGEVVETHLGTTLEYVTSVAGVYRVEVRLDGDPWIVSSGIRVRGPGKEGPR